MKILVIEPEKAPYEKEIGDDIHDMQAIVGGCIEPIYFEPKETAIAWCNDEFLLNGSQPNRIVGNVLVHGTFFVSGNYEWFCQYHLTHFIRTRIMQRERYDHSRAFFGLPEADHRWRCRFFCWPSNS